ncbi:hypothetical protein [Kocuria carniphila]|uniref:hypothetical protein n=1 Tax=Kocuria carniphila TaxID=262208 RepID=UPI0034CF9FCC
MTIQPRLTLEAELSVPMKAADIRAFLDAAEQSMDEVTIKTRPLGGQMEKMSMKLTATGTAKPRPPRPTFNNYRGGEKGKS